MNDGIFCSLSIAFTKDEQREAFLAAALPPHRDTLAKAAVDVHDPSDESPIGKKTAAKTVIGWLKKSAKSGERCLTISDGKKKLELSGYLAGVDELSVVEEALLLLVASAGTLGAEARVGFWADAGLTSEPVFRGFASKAGETTHDHFVEPQDITPADLARFHARYPFDFVAIQRARDAWLEKNVARKRAGMQAYVRADGTFQIAPRSRLSTISEGIVAFRNDALVWGYLDESGAEVVAPRFIEAHELKGGRARVLVRTARTPTKSGGHQLERKYGFLDRTGGYAIEPTFHEAADFSEGLALVCREPKRYGFIDADGKESIPFRFQEARTFGCGRALAQADDGRWGYLDAEGSWAVRPRHAMAWPFSEDVAPFFDGTSWGLLDREGNVVLPPRFPRVTYAKGGRVLGFFDGGLGVIAVGGDIVIPPEFSDIDEYPRLYKARARDGAWFTLFDRDGKRLFGDTRFAGAYASDDDRIAVQRAPDALWEYIDYEGNTVVPPRYQAAFAFGQGRAIVFDAKGVGVIDASGDIVARPALKVREVLHATPFGTSGLAAVTWFKTHLVALDGRVVAEDLQSYWGLDRSSVHIHYWKDGD